MKIYPDEIKLGIADKIRTSAKLSSKIIPMKMSEEKLAVAKTFAERAIASNYDLYPLQDIMVSAGWNLNDDVFQKQDLWEAKATPVNKHVDLDHDVEQVIGHIIG